MQIQIEDDDRLIEDDEEQDIREGLGSFNPSRFSKIQIKVKSSKVALSQSPHLFGLTGYAFVSINDGEVKRRFQVGHGTTFPSDLIEWVTDPRFPN